MSNIMNQMNLQQVTKLPVIEITKSDGVGGAIQVQTPHKGTVIIDYKEKAGFFGNKMQDKRMGEIVKQIRDLEDEAREYLLGKWLKEFYSPQE